MKLHLPSIKNAYQAWNGPDRLQEYFLYVQVIHHPTQVPVQYTPDLPDWEKWLYLDVHQIQQLAGTVGYSETFLNYLQRSKLSQPPEHLQATGLLPTGMLVLRLNATLPQLHLVVPSLSSWLSTSCKPLPPFRLIALPAEGAPLQIYFQSTDQPMLVDMERENQPGIPLLRSVAPPNSPLYLQGAIEWHPTTKGPYFEGAQIIQS